MGRPAPGINLGALRGWIVRLLLASFAVRALIPAGFMPDFDAASKGVFKVVICSAFGAQSVALDADGKPIPDQPGDKHDQPCAFAGLLAVTLPSLDTGTPVDFAFDVAISVPPLAVALPPSRAGPQLGSRGPPTFS